MIVRMILWLCVIWVPAMEYIFMANETKFKKNITIGVTLCSLFEIKGFTLSNEGFR